MRNFFLTKSVEEWKVALMATLTVTAKGQELYHTGLGNARPTGVGRNTLQTGGTADLDLIWDHDFHPERDKGRTLTPSISAFNLLNRTNYTSYVGSISSPLFGQPTAALPPR